MPESNPYEFPCKHMIRNTQYVVCRLCVEQGLEQLEELKKLKDLVNRPEITDFLKAIPLEAAHQKERWGKEHDKLKSPEDWLWVVAYLSTKAAQAFRYGDTEKGKHHIITTAALCANWFESV